MLQVVPGAADELRREQPRGAAHLGPYHQLQHVWTALSSLLSRQLKLYNTLSYLLYLFLEIHFNIYQVSRVVMLSNCPAN